MLTFYPLCGSLVGAGRTVDGILFNCLRTNSIALLHGSIFKASIPVRHTILSSESGSYRFRIRMEIHAWHVDQGELMFGETRYAGVRWKCLGISLDNMETYDALSTSVRNVLLFWVQITRKCNEQAVGGQIKDWLASNCPSPDVLHSTLHLNFTSDSGVF